MKDLRQTIEEINKEMDFCVNEIALACEKEDFVQVYAMSQKLGAFNKVVSMLMTKLPKL